jgi:transposase
METSMEKMTKQELIQELLLLKKSNENLAVSNQKLEVSNQKLAVSNQNLAVSNQKLEVSNQKLAVSNQNLAVSNQKFEVSSKAKDKVIAIKEEEVARLNLIVANLQRMLFGSKKERFIAVNTAQLQISFEDFATAEVLQDETPVKEKIVYERVKPSKHAGRNKLPENLPVVEETIEPADLTEDMVKIGEEITEILEFTPAQFFKRRIIRPKYANKKTQQITIAELPSRPIEKCLAGNSVLTHILVSKYVDHLPLYRQQQIFRRAEIEIAPSTIDSWVAQSGNFIVPLYDRMVEFVKNQRYLQADETTLRVLDKDKKGETHLGYLWVYHAPLSRMCVFDYQQGRGTDAPRQMLTNYQGALQTDGYKVYDRYCLKPEIMHLACWTHARRYFEKALMQDKQRASFVLHEIQKLYAIERKTAVLTPDQRHTIRLNEALPIINDLGKWMHRERNMVLPKSLIGKAIEYCTKLWSSLMTYLENGNYHIDNNAIENKIRPVALGRKNYLFAGSHNGAQRTAMFYTFFANCQLNGVNPEKWLKKVLDVIADYPCNKLHELFPGNLDV